MIEVRESARHGRGLFARRRIRPGRLVATCPALLLDRGDCDAVAGTPVAEMLLEWGADDLAALPLGPIALVNHADEPNCELVTADSDVGPCVELWARTDVAPGDELTIDYVVGSDRGSLWFDPA